MCEDEFHRAESSFFRLVHPTIETIASHLQYYKQPRFSGGHPHLSLLTSVCLCLSLFLPLYLLTSLTVSVSVSLLTSLSLSHVSDHLLSRYLGDGMSKGKKNLKHIPMRFLSPLPPSPP
jgi:hypothetical protein